MAKRQKVEFQTFLDGICSIWVLNENHSPMKVQDSIRFQRRVVGSKRNYCAEQAGHTIEILIRIPRTDPVARGAFVVIGEEQYSVIQAQIIPDTIPQCTDLTLTQPDILLDFDPLQKGAGGRL